MLHLAPPLRLLVTDNPKKLKKAILTMLPAVDAYSAEAVFEHVYCSLTVSPNAVDCSFKVCPKDDV